MGMLYLCATPLGNLEDITLRVIRVLGEVDLIAAEDTRHTQGLLNHFGIKTPTTSYHEHNEREKASRLLVELERGKSVALVTDAGMPCVSDPGYLLVQAVLDAGYPLTALPGPSAVVTALALSGFKPYPFYFQGFLPRNGKERRELLADLQDDERTGVFYEAPHRLLKTLEDLCTTWCDQRRIAVARELTKQFEEVVRGSIAEVLAHFQAEAPRGEITIVVEGKQQSLPDDSEQQEQLMADPNTLKGAVNALIQIGADLQSACKGVALASGLSKSDVYRVYHRE